MRNRLVVTPHAIERLRERKERYQSRSDGDLYGVIYGMTCHALPYGAQFGDSQLLRGDERSGADGLVFVVRKKEGARIVLTVLTEEQAIANMQASGVRWRSRI